MEVDFSDASQKLVSETEASDNEAYEESEFEYDHHASDAHSWWDTHFLVAQRGSTLATEVQAGVLLFGTMCYILAVNPAVMAGAGFEPLHSAAATSICGMVATLGLSIVVNVPFGAAPGMGLNTIFAYELIRQNHLSRAQALAVSFVAGLLFVILACMGWCGRILNCIPLSLKKAMVVSIGLFQTLVGFYNMDLIVEGQFSILQFKGFSDPKQLVALFTLVSTATLILFEVPSSIFFGVLASVFVAAVTGLTSLPVGSSISTLQGAIGQFFNPPVSVLEMPDFDFSIFTVATGWASLAFLFIVVFVDTAGVMVGVAAQGEGLLDKRNGRVVGDRGCYVILGFGVMLSALMGTSPIIMYVLYSFVCQQDLLS